MYWKVPINQLILNSQLMPQQQHCLLNETVELTMVNLIKLRKLCNAFTFLPQRHFCSGQNLSLTSGTGLPYCEQMLCAIFYENVTPLTRDSWDHFAMEPGQEFFPFIRLTHLSYQLGWADNSASSINYISTRKQWRMLLCRLPCKGKEELASKLPYSLWKWMSTFTL